MEVTLTTDRVSGSDRTDSKRPPGQMSQRAVFFDLTAGSAEERASEHEELAQEERESATEHHAAADSDTTPPA